MQPMESGADFVQSKSHHSFWNGSPVEWNAKSLQWFCRSPKGHQVVVFIHAGIELSCGATETWAAFWSERIQHRPLSNAKQSTWQAAHSLSQGSAGSCSKCDLLVLSQRDTQRELIGHLWVPQYSGSQEACLWGKHGSTGGLMLCCIPWFLLKPGAMTTARQRFFTCRSHFKGRGTWVLPPTLSWSDLDWLHAAVSAPCRLVTVLPVFFSMTFTVLVAVSTDNGESAVLQL